MPRSLSVCLFVFSACSRGPPAKNLPLLDQIRDQPASTLCPETAARIAQTSRLGCILAASGLVVVMVAAVFCRRAPGTMTSER